MTGDELDLVETSDLVEAIQRRFKASLLVAIPNAGNLDPQDRDEDLEAVDYWWKGGRITCLGLAEAARHRILHVAVEREGPE